MIEKLVYTGENANQLILRKVNEIIEVVNGLLSVGSGYRDFPEGHIFKVPMGSVEKDTVEEVKKK